MPADLVLINGEILTMNPSQPHAEAIAIKATKITCVGSNPVIRAHVGKATKVINLNGKTVVPGFIDSHIHVADFGRMLTWLDLSSVTSIKELQSLLSAYAEKTPKGKWIIGRGWERESLSEKRLPTRQDLDVSSPDNPVILFRGQMCIVNSKALEISGLNKKIVTCNSSMVRQNKSGEPTGVLRDDAANTVWNFVPSITEAELLEGVKLAFEKILKAGITSVCWMVFSPIELSIIQKLKVQNELPLSMYVIVPIELFDRIIISASKKDSTKKNLNIIGAIIFADGYLAARTAALSQPYTDCPDSRGSLLYTQEQIDALVDKVHQAGLQVVIHAAGDRAVDAALTAIEKTSKKALDREPRNRIEQAAVINEELFHRIKKDDVIISVQPCVIDSEFRVWSAVSRLGQDRLRWLYPLKKLISSGIRIIGGSDCPMEPLSPLLGIRAAVARGFIPQERVSVEEALRFYTVDAAYAFKEENFKGSIEVSKLADLTVLPHDLLAANLNGVDCVEVEMTIAKGKIVYSKS
jgi:predicted amidohydrolase YtcJ